MQSASRIAARQQALEPDPLLYTRCHRSGRTFEYVAPIPRTQKVTHLAHAATKDSHHVQPEVKALALHTIVKLTPPAIAPATIKQEIVCTRPMREGRFNIGCSTMATAVGDKTRVDCYGHGGSGWTTLFGSVQSAIELFEKSNPSKATPIRVVGSGCMGLTTAIELTRRGYQVAGISTKSLYDMPSWRAAGYFALVSVKTSKEEQDNLNAIGLNTFKAYQQIDNSEHPYLTKECVRFLPVYCSHDTDSGVEDLEKKGLIPKREQVTLDFGNGVQHKNYVRFMTYFMDTTELMQQLTKTVKRLQIPIEMQEVTSFDAVKEAVVFNCAGLGARELNKDDQMIPVRGHLVALNEAAGTKHMDYMIYTKVKQDGKEEYIYMFPKAVSVTPEKTAGVACRAVLGGTFIPHVDKLPQSEQDALDRREMGRMLERNSQFFHGKAYAH